MIRYCFMFILINSGMYLEYNVMCQFAYFAFCKRPSSCVQNRMCRYWLFLKARRPMEESVCLNIGQGNPEIFLMLAVKLLIYYKPAYSVAHIFSYTFDWLWHRGMSEFSRLHISCGFNEQGDTYCYAISTAMMFLLSAHL